MRTIFFVLWKGNLGFKATTALQPEDLTYWLMRKGKGWYDIDDRMQEPLDT